MVQQSAFSFDWPDDWRQDSYIVSDVNRLAFLAVTQPHLWPFVATVIQGGQASGKTHLVHMFIAQTGAVLVDQTNLGQPHWQRHRAYAIDNVDQLIGDAATEEAIVHIFNAARANDDRLLLTTSRDLATLHFALPDLRSRLLGSNLIALDFPDEAILHGLYTKLFTDRQILIKPEVVHYLVTHAERSFAAVHHLVQAIDQWTLATGKAVTIPAIKTFLHQTTDPSA